MKNAYRFSYVSGTSAIQSYKETCCSMALEMRYIRDYASHVGS